MPRFRKHRPGDKLKISAPEWNGIVESAEAYHAGKLSVRDKTGKVIPNAGIKLVAQMIESERFSAMGVTGPGGTPDLPRMVQEPLLARAGWGTSSLAVSQDAVVANGGVSAVVDGLTPVRVKLGRSPGGSGGSVMRRASLVSGEKYLRADTLGQYELIWHGNKKADEPEATAEKGDIVWGIVRLGAPIVMWVHCVPELTSGICERVSGYYPGYCFVRYGEGGYSHESPCWISFEHDYTGGIPLWSSDLRMTGYHRDFVSVGSGEEAEERPVIMVDRHPVDKIRGIWAPTNEAETEGTITLTRGGVEFSVAGVNCDFGGIQENKKVAAEYFPCDGWFATATEC